jgi:hypothetical protein
MAVSDDNVTPLPEHCFTFGLWSVGNPLYGPRAGRSTAPSEADPTLAR